MLLDTDKLGHVPERDLRARQLLQTEGLIAIWQQPCHEALLLRHLPNCAMMRPATSADALQQLVARWNNYQRPMAAMRLAERLTYESIRQAAEVEAEFKAFLDRLRL